MPVKIPESPKVVFDKNFLLNTICQIRVQPILKIGLEIPSAFQEKIRKKYPIVEAEEGIQFNIKNVVTPEIQSEKIGRKWKFKSPQGDWVISLESSFIAVTTSSYERFSIFSERLKEILDAYVETYEPSETGRIGLRYINHIRPPEQPVDIDGWKKWVKPELMGFTANPIVDGPLERSIAEIRTSQEPGNINIRHGLLPEKSGDLFYLLDVDRFIMKSIPVPKVFDYLDKFNKDSFDFFMWSITQDSKDYLGVKDGTR